MPETLDAVEVILAKRDGGELSDSQIDWVIDAYTRGAVADEQMSALAMAILLNGMDRREIARWTAAMIASGERMDFSTLSRPDRRQALDRRRRRQDHAAAGAAGRRVRRGGAAAVRPRPRPHRRHARQARVDPRLARGAVERGDVRPARVGRRGDLRGRATGWRPADKKLYALRDVTGTVEAIPLIASSIMSQEDRRGHRLAGARRQGRHRGVHEGRRARPRAGRRPWSASAPTPACTRSRCSPTCPPRWGCTAGNAIEVAESVEVLAGGGPADVVELTLALAREMLAGAGVTDVDPAEVLASGRAMDVWKAMIRAQDGDPDAPLPAGPGAARRHRARRRAC